MRAIIPVLLLLLLLVLLWATPAEAYVRQPATAASPSGQQLQSRTSRSLYQQVLTRHRVSLGFLDRYQHVLDRAIDRLRAQVGEPYQWGGESPSTGFDCSGLVYFAYRSVLNIDLPRTANGMYQLSAATPVDKGELRRGDLVFFRIHSGPSVADHVGVYLGEGNFIQAPRAGKRIHISALSNDYWRRHYLGARRVLSLENMAFNSTLDTARGG